MYNRPSVPPRQRSGRHLPFVVPAVQGFVRSISLNTGNSLQDTLRLLTLWFEYGQVPEVNEALTEGLRKIKIDNWLQVRAGPERGGR